MHLHLKEEKRCVSGGKAWQVLIEDSGTKWCDILRK